MVPKTTFRRVRVPPSQLRALDYLALARRLLHQFPALRGDRRASLISRPQKPLERRPGSSALGPNPAGEGRQDPNRRSEPTGGAATSRLRCAFSAGPSALPGLAAVGCAPSPVAAHPEDEIEDEEQDSNIDQRSACPQESPRTLALGTPSLSD
ncbi:rCG48348 [Rattus norvegicus]|uniref:RCG48348 n=1 Tax=Rattus norvegicus TaxID=10116 RepID=A6HY96_RAT|nr:rCG48348 [Rattus norvegicus]